MPGRPQSNAAVSAASRLRELAADFVKIAKDLGDSVSSKDAHKLRTSIRRIEVANEAVGKFRGAKKLQKQLDRLRKAAGHVRDIDVQTDLLKNLDAGDYAADCERLQQVLHRRRDKQEKKTLAAVSRELSKGLEDRLEEAASALESSEIPRKISSKERVEHIRAQYIEFTAEIPVDGDPLHDLRKACKRLRYRLEAIPGRESRSFEKDLKVVQDAIGTWHDWATVTDQAEVRLEPRSIAFVAFLRSQMIARRHEARRAVQTLREKLLKASTIKKPPARASQLQSKQVAAR